MKTCPVCHARSFEDMKTCFSCMHRFDEEDMQGAPEAAEPAEPPRRIEIPMVTMAEPLQEAPSASDSASAQTAPLPSPNLGLHDSFFEMASMPQRASERGVRAVYRLVVSLQPVLEEGQNGLFDVAAVGADHVAETNRQ